MRRTIRTTLACAASAAVIATSALAGGDNIASAPDLPLGQHLVNGRTGLDFYRVPLGVGDLFSVDLGSVDGEYVQICMFKPNVTDYTIDNADCVPSKSTQQKTQFNHIANVQGRWTMVAGNGSCIYENSGGIRIPCQYDTAYELTALVRRYTATTATVPRSARRGSRITILGKVTGADGGRVEIAVKPAGKPWSAASLVQLRGGGMFRWATRISVAGIARIRVVYRGDAAHRASRTTRSVRVVR